VPRALGSSQRLVVCLAHRLNLLPLQLGCRRGVVVIIISPRSSSDRGRGETSG
jgi:hypothetical protein